MTSTLQELRQAEKTLPDRITAAAMAGDVVALTALEQERSTLPFALRAAEIAELRLEIASAKSIVAETSAAVRVERERMAVRAAEKLEYERQYRLTAAAAARVMNSAESARDDLRALENRLDKLIAEATGWAETQRAPVVRSLWHMPTPK